MKPFRFHPRSLADDLRAEPTAFELHQALRILERMRPGTLLPGETTLFDRESVRFSSAVSKSFPPADLAGLVIPPTFPQEPPTLVVHHLGLAGAHGILPEFVTDEILRQLKRGSSPLRDFLDIFNHRLVALHARVRRTYRPTYSNVPPEHAPAARIFFALIGLGMPVLRNASGIVERELLPFAGLMAGNRFSKAAIEAIVAESTGCPATVIPFRPAWLQLDPRTFTRIGTHGQNSQLGRTAICGTRAYNPLDGCILRIGPCSATRFSALIPGGTEHHRLGAIVRFLSHDAMSITVELELDRQEVRPAVLGTADAALGVRAWLMPHRRSSTEPRPFIATVLRYRWAPVIAPPSQERVANQSASSSSVPPIQHVHGHKHSALSRAAQ